MEGRPRADTIRDAYAALQDGDLERLRELVTPNVVVRLDPAVAPTADLEFRGIDALQHLLPSDDQRWQVRARPRAFAEVGAEVAVLSEVEIGSVRLAAMVSASIWRFDGHRICSVESWTDAEQVAAIKRRFGVELPE